MWYVIQVMGGQEEPVRQQIERLVDHAAYRSCFVPRYEIKKCFKGEWRMCREILFPGYVFVDTARITAFNAGLRSIGSMTKILADGNGAFVPLAEEEKTMIEAFLGKQDSIMRMSEGVIEGDEIVILKGPLMNHVGSVKKINRHKRIAYLEVGICGRRVRVKAGLEIVSKRPTTQ